MKKQLVVHITFFYKEERLYYLKQVILGLKTINDVNIFIHSNQKFEIDNATVIFHDISNIHPFLLTWKCRDLMKSQVNSYNYYMYIEDDVLFNNDNFEYYLEWHEKCKNINSYLGFLRIEKNKDGKIFLGDLIEQLNTYVMFDQNKMFKCNRYRYSAMWLLDNDEMNIFINKYRSLYNFETLHYENGISMARENSAIGPLYEMFENILVSMDHRCFIHHLPNPAVDNPNVPFGKIPVERMIK